MLSSRCVCSCCLHRLVRCMLGHGAISESKLSHGNPLVLLGVRTKIDRDGVSFRPDDAKAQKWSAKIQMALESDMLHGGDSFKLAGACSGRHKEASNA